MEEAKKQPLISVIIPVYNIEKYLRRCLESVIHQSYRNLEIILVDDGSSDSSGIICDEYAATDPRIKVIHMENGGAGPARNAGLDVASGEYIGFVDGDDFIEEDMYEYLIETIESSGADISQCGIIESYAEQEIMPRYSEYFELADNVTGLHRLLRSNVSSMHIFNKLYKSSLFDTIRFYNIRVLEDNVMLTEIMTVAQSICITNIPKYHYYRRPNSLTTCNIREEMFDEIGYMDLVYDTSVHLSPLLEEPARMRKCWVRFAVLDKIYAEGRPFNPEREKELIRFLRGEKKLILMRDYFTRGRKLAYVGLLINRNLYMWIVHWYYKRNRLIHS